MAWWQKKILRYALSRTGFLDDSTIDLDNLDVALGRQNVVHFKDVGLNIARISKLAQLPPSLRVETARVLSLRLNVPADIYQAGIVAEVDGLEVILRLEQQDEAPPPKSKPQRARSPVTTRSPQHRKMHRRIHSPPPFDDSGGLSDSDEPLATMGEVAQSFYIEESTRERRELEVAAATQAKGIEESIASESSSGESADYGTGATIGVPGFLAGFLQGIVDRLQIKVKTVDVKVETELPGDVEQPIPVALRLHVGDIEFGSAGSAETADTTASDSSGQRRMKLNDVYVNLLSDVDTFSELSELPSRSSPAASRHPASSNRQSSTPSELNMPTARTPSSPTQHSSTSSKEKVTLALSPDALQASIATADSDRFADAGDEVFSPTMPDRDTDFDIQPGDDNISWGSRCNRSKVPAEDLWNSMASEDDLPDSLLLDRASTPQPPSTRSGSPSVTRNRRDISPYSRHLQSPRSWPKMDESHYGRVSSRPSPGSWPNLEQSRHGMFASLDAEAVASNSGTTSDEAVTDTDNAVSDDAIHDQTGDTPAVEDLATSRMFSHEEAESMFMSAMSNRPMHVPGGWGSDTASQASSPTEERRPPIASQQQSGLITRDEDDGLAYGELPPEPESTRSGQATPRASSPAPNQRSQASIKPGRSTAEKRILHVDYILVLLPTSPRDNDEDIRPGRPTPRAISDSFAPTGIPGTFSAYSEMSASRRQKSASFAREGSGASSILASSIPAVQDRPEEDSSNVNIEVGTLSSHVDVPCGRLLYRATLQAAIVLRPVSDERAQKPNIGQSPKENASNLAIRVLRADFAFVEHLENVSHISLPSSRQLMALGISNVELASTAGDFDVRIGTLETLLGGHHLLRFDQSREMKSSIFVSDSTPDIGFKVSNRGTTSRRVVKDIVLETMPLDLTFDLAVFDETFSSFGGLSGILEAGNSILSESGMTSFPASPKIAKGVRFEVEPTQRPSGTEIKFSGRIGGVATVLQGENCSVKLRTTTLKTLYREQAMAVTFEHAVLSGPWHHDKNLQAVDPIAIDLSTARLDYLVSPQEKDLDRLLSLLTPSKDKYDGQDEILIDTLLRQRRKGAAARVSVADIKVNISTWDNLPALQSLGDELSKFSAVTKYLPEDERPGLLSLVRVKSSEIRVPVNDRFGKIHVSVSDMHCAHIGLPALFALSVGELQATQNGETKIVHPLLPAENLPVVMVRMLGGEIEPLVKVKLYNLCAEYSVPALLAATGLDEHANPEEVVVGLAKSIADLALQDKNISPQRASGTSNSPSRSPKMTKIELLFHDSAVGLQPQKLSSKAMFVLSDAVLSTVVPPEDTSTAELQLRKAAVFVADEVLEETTEANLPPRGTPPNTATGVKLTTALSSRGYVSIGSIMSATIGAKAVQSTTGTSRSIEVDVRNELLLLETCADTTQTLIATLNGLAPPTPPSKQLKYLTEPMTIEDMMASFSGEPQVKKDRPPETLFDAEADPEDDPEAFMKMVGFDEDDDRLLAESEMEASLYGPISGMLGVDRPEDEDELDNFTETAESLLEDDPFEMPGTPADARMSDAALFKELRKQCKPSVTDPPVDLGLWEIDDLGFDALGGAGQQPLGTRHRFNTPASRKKTSKARKDVDLPFRLRLRDVHIIWNIYDGYDWKRTREGITQVVEQVEQKAEERKAKRRQSHTERGEEESVIGDFLFNSIYIGVPSTHDAQELRRQINKGIDDLASETESVPVSGMSRPTTAYSASGPPLRPRQRRRLKLQRSRAHKVAFELKGVSADVLVFPSDNPDTVSSIDVRVRDFEIFDNVPTSTWRKFLTHLESDPAARELAKPMMHIEMLNVKTLEQYAASEIVMHVSVLPIRLHVDQDALDFITRFFEFKDQSMTGSTSVSDQPFLQRVEVDTVDMCLDYKPKRVDYGGIRSGHYTEFKNFVILDGANIKLKHAIIYGIKGFEPLHQTLNDVWMPDIKRNQLPTVLAGLAPVRSLVNIGSGVRDVVAIPIREYRKDGRVVRSIQKGAMHFGKTTTSELARLGAKVAMGTQTFLTSAEGLLSPASASPRPGSGRRVSSEQGWHETTSSDDDASEKRVISAYANQPLGVFSGLRSARRQLELDLLTARDALIAVQGEMTESATPGSAAAAVARHAPTVILRPVIGASRAVGTALLGVGNQIDRSNVRKVEDKYKRR